MNRIARVGDIAEQIRGVTYSKGDALPLPRPGFVPILRAGNIQDAGLSFDDLVYVPRNRVTAKQLVRRDDVLIAASSGSLEVVGKAARSPEDFDGGFGAFLKVLRPTTGVDPAYFAHYFRTPEYRRKVSALAAGANINNLKNEHLNELLIPLPGRNEQRRIAAILDQADALCAKRRSALCHLDDIGQSIFLDMFGKFSGKFSTVEELAAPEKGSIRTGPFGSQLLHSEFVDDGIAVLGLDNVVGNQFSWRERRYITPGKYQELRRYTVRPGDVLVSIMGTCGRCVVVPANIGAAINTKHICAITLDQNVALPEFVRASFLWHPRSRQHLTQRTKGSIMDGLNMGIIKEMPLPLPPLEDQLRFVKTMGHVDELSRKCLRSGAELNYLFASLQSRAFSGQL